jgi:formylmethanofuran--tetrahydromethanopterin N-formyltransferase
MKTFKLNRVEVEDTFAEASDGLYCRLLITAERGLTEADTNGPFIEYDPLRFAAYRATATPSTVVGRIEAGIEKWLPKDKTPDGREGVVVQFWGMYNKKKSLREQAEKFYKEMSIRIRQDILSASEGTTRVFDWMPLEKSVHKINSEEKVGKCGGGHETFLKEYRREVINIPLMMEDFKIDTSIKCEMGISGANFWIFCDSKKAGRIAGRAAVEAIKTVDGVITPFYVCPSGSMVEDYPPIGPPTNYQYCPTLKNKIKDSKVPEGVKSIPEIVIDGMDLPSVKNAMREGIYAAVSVDGVKMISAGNYEGKLGEHKIHLRKLFV